MYKLVQDEDTHWYLVPVDKLEYFYEQEEKCYKYWNSKQWETEEEDFVELEDIEGVIRINSYNDVIIESFQLS